MISPLGLEVQKIHACYNNCILYRDKYVELDQCPVCELSRYKSEDCPEAMTIVDRNKRPPKKVVWHFPIIPRLEIICERKKNRADEVLCQKARE
jgi:hypothetical protein